MRPISVAAREGARNRDSSSSSASRSSVAARRLRSRSEVRRPAMELCVGVPISEGVYLGLGSELVFSRLLLLASSRLRALGLALTLARSVETNACCGFVDSASRLPGRECGFDWTWSLFPSDNAKHNSVRLRHKLSVFRRTCLSETILAPPPIVD